VCNSTILRLTKRRKMEKIFCQIHNLNISIYSKEEEQLFIDDNEQESVIFDNGINKYLKRFAIGQCDENCEIIKQILEE